MTIARPTRPSIGDVTRVNSRSSSAARSAASTAATCAADSSRERGAALVLLVRHRVLAGEPAGALELRLRAANRRARSVQLGAQPIDFGLERTRVDLKERIAAPDDRAFLEAHGGDVPGHARTDGDRVHGFEPAGELVPLGDVLRSYFGDRHLRGRRLTGLSRGASATGGQNDGEHSRQDDSVPRPAIH